MRMDCMDIYFISGIWKWVGCPTETKWVCSSWYGGRWSKNKYIRIGFVCTCFTSTIGYWVGEIENGREINH